MADNLGLELANQDLQHLQQTLESKKWCPFDRLKARVQQEQIAHPEPEWWAAYTGRLSCL